MEEIWKKIEGFENYEVSSFGRVKSFVQDRNGKILKQYFDPKNGYNNIGLRGVKIKKFLVHRLVAIAFKENPENKPEVNHKDGVKTNNHIDNLEWSTSSENTKHSYQIGLAISPFHGRKRSTCYRIKPVLQFTLNDEFVRRFECIQDTIDEGFTPKSVCAACRGQLKTHRKFKWKYANRN